jgi:hypothetical protein
MDASASPSIRSSGPRWSLLRVLEAVVLTLAITSTLVSFPGPPGSGLDASWQEMLIHARERGMQFGREILFTWGPWGYVWANYHLGAAGAARLLAWKLAASAGVALALVLLTRSLAPWRRLAFAAVFMAFNWFFLDVAFFDLIALIGIAGLMRRGAALYELAAWACVLGLLSQIKFTYQMLSAAAVLAAVACLAGRRSWRGMAAVALAYALSVAAAWVGAGQHLPNLWAYLRGSVEIAGGYADAMGIDEPPAVFVCGASLAAACAAFAWAAWRKIPERGYGRCASAFLAFSMFLMWKEGFTRADGHVMGFFAFILTLLAAVPSLLFPGRRWHPFEASALLCLLGMAAADPGMLLRVPRVSWERIHGNTAMVLRLGLLPEEWQRSLEQSAAPAALPAITAAVGRGTVDVYDCLTAAAILNGMNLATRPVFQSYSAYTPRLERLNLRSYQSGRAPDFLMWGDERVDGRYPGQDDAMLIAALPAHYAPLFSEGGFWLLKRTSALSGAQPERRLIYNARVRLSDEVVLPPQRDQAIWLRADAVANALGRARALLYKPARIDLVTTDDEGQHRSWRLVPRTARDGLVLVPTLAQGSDMALFLSGEANSWVRSFHFEAPGSQGEFWSYVDVGVFGMPGMPLKPVFHAGPLVELGILDRAPISVSSTVSVEIIDIDQAKALQLHAEGELVMGVPPGASRLTFGYGIREGAYLGSGHTDGVDFAVDAVWASGRRERLWERYLDPVARAEDRGTQRLDLALPGDAPIRLVLHTGAGPRNDNRWDWSYVCSLRIQAPGAP